VITVNADFSSKYNDMNLPFDYSTSSQSFMFGGLRVAADYAIRKNSVFA